jgi:hypothetical protein
VSKSRIEEVVLGLGPTRWRPLSSFLVNGVRRREGSPEVQCLSSRHVRFVALSIGQRTRRAMSDGNQPRRKARHATSAALGRSIGTCGEDGEVAASMAKLDERGQATAGGRSLAISGLPAHGAEAASSS